MKIRELIGEPQVLEWDYSLEVNGSTFQTSKILEVEGKGKRPYESTKLLCVTGGQWKNLEEETLEIQYVEN